MNMDSQYNENKLRKEFTGLIDRNRNVLFRFFNKDEAEDILQKSITNYDALIPQIPWIGGKENSLTDNLIGAAQLLAVIISLKSTGVEFRKTGEIVYALAENNLKNIHPILVYFVKKYIRSKSRLNKMLKASLESQKKRYPDDWVFEYKIVNNEDVLFENTYSECAICKFYQKMGYAEYLPFLCLVDYATFSAFGLKLERTMTIGNGDSVCDFKILKHGENKPGWPPENHKEYKH